MKKTLLIAALASGFTLSQTVQAQDVAQAASRTAEPPRAEVAADAGNYHLAQVINTEPALPAAEPQGSTTKTGMPSVPYGLIGLFVMICVLIKRRNDPN